MRDPRGQVRRAALRVALTATTIVGGLYVVVCAVVMVIVSHNMTADIDRRLSAGLAQLEATGHLNLDPAHGYGPPGGAPQFGAPFLVWTVFPDGSVASSTPGASLPSEGLQATTPRTVTVNGVDLRVTGRDIRNVRAVLGQSTEAIGQTQANLLTAETIVAPLLLTAVFVGATVVGRRAAAPIERARQRQLALTADASHELRTPLAVIQAQASLATECARDTAWYENALRRIDAESRRMRRLVDDMLWLARFDAADATPQAELVDLAVLAEVHVDRFTTLAERRGITLTSQLTSPAIVRLPPEWLDRVLGVLLDNACRYTPDGGAVRLTVADDGDRLQITVDDSGPGIPAADLGHIFDRFQRASQVPGGAGLGLAIADAVVGASGGRWRIGVSALGGASMSVSWPRNDVSGRTHLTGPPSAITGSD